MNLAITDLMPIGKYKGHGIDDLIVTDPGYLLWLRDERKREGRPQVFNNSVMETLDKVLAVGPAKLRMKHKPWHVETLAEPAPLGDAPIQKSTEPQAKKPDDAPAQETAYKDQWGEF